MPRRKRKKKALGENKLPKVMKQLMHVANITEAKLARALDMPQGTVNRLLLGFSEDPRIATVQPIADFFGVSMEQLIGKEPLYLGKHLEQDTDEDGGFRYKTTSLPILEWEHVQDWVNLQEKLLEKIELDWITTERHVTEGSYALLSKPFLNTIIPANTPFVVDRHRKGTHGQLAIILNENGVATARRIYEDGDKRYLAPLCCHLPAETAEKHSIVGVVVEARLEFN